jgi:peroxiredoxin
MKLTFSILVITFFWSNSIAQKQTATKTFPIKIEGEIVRFEGRTIYLHHKWDEKDITDSAKIFKGKFTFSLKSVDPNMYWFTLSNDINAQPNYIFFADAAPIKIRLLADSLPFSSIQAGQTQNDYVDYRLIISNFINIQQKMQSDFNQAVQTNDINTQNAIRAEYQNLNQKYIEGLKSFIRTHPKSAVAGYVIYSDFNNPNIPLKEVEEALSYIDKGVAETKFVKLANKRIDLIRGTTVGYTANNFSQTSTDGKKVSLSDFKGKYVLIDFWASWCRPCRMENPNVVAAYNRFKSKGFTVLGVSMDSNRDPWLAAIQQDNLTWTHVSDLKGWGNEVGKLYGVTGIPQNYLIDREGKIVAKDLRGPALDEKLAEILK